MAWTVLLLLTDESSGIYEVKQASIVAVEFFLWLSAVDPGILLLSLVDYKRVKYSGRIIDIALTK